MTKVATKAPERSTVEERIADLAERLAEHHTAVSGIEAKASKQDADAQAADERAAAILRDFERPAEGLHQDVLGLKASAQYYRAGAALLRERAAAYRATNQMDSLEAEHRMLIAQEKARVEAEAAAKRQAEFTREFEARIPQYRAALLALEALEWRLNFLVDQNVATPRAFAVRNETQQAVRWAIRNMTTDAQRRDFMQQNLPKLDA